MEVLSKYVTFITIYHNGKFYDSDEIETIGTPNTRDIIRQVKQTLISDTCLDDENEEAFKVVITGIFKIQ